MYACQTARVEFDKKHTDQLAQTRIFTTYFLIGLAASVVFFDLVNGFFFQILISPFLFSSRNVQKIF